MALLFLHVSVFCSTLDNNTSHLLFSWIPTCLVVFIHIVFTMKYPLHHPDIKIMIPFSVGFCDISFILATYPNTLPSLVYFNWIDCFLFVFINSLHSVASATYNTNPSLAIIFMDLFLIVCVCVMVWFWSISIFRGQEKMSDLLHLEFLAIISCLIWVLRTECKSLCKTHTCIFKKIIKWQ